jgi:CubicO group peptidase (beta-lactamase class C family)
VSAGALGSARSWPVPAAAAVVGPGGVLETTGPVDRVLPWASVTKLVSALAVLVAVEEGTVGLDDPAGPPGSTLRHLLAHASGLAPDDDRVLAPPATRRIYSNRGVELAAGVVAGASGIAFGEYATAAVLEPLGMTATTLRGSPASGAHGPLADLARLAAELLAPTLIDEATLRAATTVAFPGLAGVLPGYGRHDPNDWGLGPEIRGDKRPHWTGRANSPATFGHFGRSGSFLWVDPVAGVACVELAGTAWGPWAQEAWPRLADDVLAVYTERR